MSDTKQQVIPRLGPNVSDLVRPILVDQLFKPISFRDFRKDRAWHFLREHARLLQIAQRFHASSGTGRTILQPLEHLAPPSGSPFPNPTHSLSGPLDVDMHYGIMST